MDNEIDKSSEIRKAAQHKEECRKNTHDNYIQKESRPVASSNQQSDGAHPKRNQKRRQCPEKMRNWRHSRRDTDPPLQLDPLALALQKISRTIKIQDAEYEAAVTTKSAIAMKETTAARACPPRMLPKLTPGRRESGNPSGASDHGTPSGFLSGHPTSMKAAVARVAAIAAAGEPKAAATAALCAMARAASCSAAERPRGTYDGGKTEMVLERESVVELARFLVAVSSGECEGVRCVADRESVVESQKMPPPFSGIPMRFRNAFSKWTRRNVAVRLPLVEIKSYLLHGAPIVTEMSLSPEKRVTGLELVSC